FGLVENFQSIPRRLPELRELARPLQLDVRQHGESFAEASQRSDCLEIRLPILQRNQLATKDTKGV
ncbi:hypothetical protein, partial [Mesorhizobium sp.]|uniref:hypothetical protein n=1 Tax=Mesorhizobium sp. TaxID=1871066 RepID=UPI00257C5AEC